MIVGFLSGGLIGSILMFGGGLFLAPLLGMHGEETWAFVIFHPFIIAPIGAIIGLIIGIIKAKKNNIT